ncbi:MAG TPA: TetR/AcrR family transcriptional regulator [Thermomicrobiales bacterium]|nr:TetR/AcrR family transcriptional regulator [Thermomicrobiales bacterium]
MSDRKTGILEAACRVIARRGVRGLRVEEIAREAGVSVALIYYYFEGRAELLRRALEYVNERADDYTRPPLPADAPAPDALVAMLLREIQDDPTVVESVVVWHELLASAIFEPGLREAVSRSDAGWVASIAAVVRRGQAEGTIPPPIDADAVAQRLTALVEGLSARWLIGALSADGARALVRRAVAQELAAEGSRGGGESESREARAEEVGSGAGVPPPT